MGNGSSKSRKGTSGHLTEGFSTVAAVAKTLARLEIGINEAVNDDGETALFVAIREGQADAVSSLLENGADPNLVSKQGLTPFHVATLCGNRDVILALLGTEKLNVKARTKKKYRESVRIKDKDVEFDIAEGSNVLDILAKREHRDLTSVLLLFDTIVEDESSSGNAEAEPVLGMQVCRAAAAEKAKRKWMVSIKAKREEKKAVEQLLTQNEKETIVRHRDALLGMKTYLIMVHLFSFKVLCEQERQELKLQCHDNRRKAAEYIIDQVVLEGSYCILENFKEALKLARQSHLANLLPTRE